MGSRGKREVCNKTSLKAYVLCRSCYSSAVLTLLNKSIPSHQQGIQTLLFLKVDFFPTFSAAFKVIRDQKFCITFARISHPVTPAEGLLLC